MLTGLLFFKIQMKQKILLSFFLSITLVSVSFASYLDDWPDDALCQWMANPSPPVHIVEEVKKRGISCEAGKVVTHSVKPSNNKNTSSASKVSLKTTNSSLSINIEIEFYPAIFSDEMQEKLYDIVYSFSEIAKINNEFNKQFEDDSPEIIQSTLYDLGYSASYRDGDYDPGSQEVFLDGGSSEKFYIQPLNCDLTKSPDCNNNNQRVMMVEKDKTSDEETKLYEWSMFVPESNIFPKGSHLKYVIFLTEGDCNVGGEIVFMEFGDPWAGFRFSLADGFNRDETTIIKSSDVTGKWHNFKLEAHWSRKENGYIRLMVNDIYVEEYKGQTLKCDQIQMTYGLLRAQIKKSNLVKSISNSVYFDNVKISNIDNSNPSIFLNAKLGKLNKKIQANNIHDGEYTFRLYVRFEGEGNSKIGSGLFEIKNGNIIFINKKQSQLKTGSRDFYDTLEGQIDEDGQFYGSIELDILGGKDRSEVYTLKGPINGKIWGDSPDECCARVYFLPRLKK